MNYSKVINYTIISTIIVTAIACGSKATTEPVAETQHKEDENTVELTAAQYKTADIELGKTETRQISSTIRVNGKLDVPPQQMISVSVPIGGFLKSTPLLQGTRVAKGQVLATIENLDFIQMQQEYLEAKNQIEFTKTDYERQLELAKENVNSQKTLQQAKTTYTSWQTKANGLREKLNVLNINIAELEAGKIKSTINLYSPINGYVTEVNVNLGKFVSPSDILFEIVDTEHLHAELTVFEKDVPRLRIGQKVRFTLANETKERIATVYLLGREIAEDRTIRIHCHIDKEDTNLLPGMYLKAVVQTDGVEVQALPERAVVDYQGKKYIFYQLEKQPHNALKDENKEQHEGEYHFAMLEIEVGNSEMGYTEVVFPAYFPSETALIVVKNAYAILSKMKNNEDPE